MFLVRKRVRREKNDESQLEQGLAFTVVDVKSVSRKAVLC